MREDRLVRRGIEVLKKRHGSGDEGESDEEAVAVKPKGKGKETIVDVETVQDGERSGVSTNHGEDGQGKTRKRKSNAAKKVSQGRLAEAHTAWTVVDRIG
jgi:hypothetical protein